jgi:hypothetical protein
VFLSVQNIKKLSIYIHMAAAARNLLVLGGRGLIFFEKKSAATVAQPLGLHL